MKKRWTALLLALAMLSALAVGALLAGILFFWVAGKDFVLAAVNKGAGKPIGAWFYPLSKYVYCACALLALIAGALLGGIG